MYDVIIVGGGVSGVMCAINASKKNKVAIIEKNSDLLRKFKITGNKRCNILNYCGNDELIKHVHNGKFLYSALKHCNSNILFNYFTNLGIKLKIEDHNRVYPQSDDAKEISNALEKQLKNVDVFLNENVIKVDSGFKIKTNKRILDAKKVVISTGGVSYPATGSTGDGYAFAKQFNHNINKLYPVEVPIISNDDFIQSKILQGVSVKDVNLKLYNNKKCAISYTHDLLFTHFGISGPCALGCAEIISKNPNKEYIARIDFFPKIHVDELHKKIIGVTNNNKSLKNSLKSLTQSRLLSFFASEIELDLEKKVNEISPKKLRALAEIMKNFSFNVHGTRSIQYAFVTGGGVNLKEVNPNTFESKLKKNLYIIGETLDIHGKIGGFNLLTFFVSGYVCGRFI